MRPYTTKTPATLLAALMLASCSLPLAHQNRGKELLTVEEYEARKAAAEKPPATVQDTGKKAVQADTAGPAQNLPVKPADNPLPKDQPTVATQKKVADADPSGLPDPAKKRHKVRAVGKAPLVTVSFLETPIEDVVTSFAAYSGRSIVLGEDVKDKKITADIKNQPWDAALEFLLAANQLEPTQDDSTGMIMIRGMQAARDYEKSERAVPKHFKISYADVTEIATNLKNVFKDIQISEVKSTKSLLITASPEDMEDIAAMIKHLDVRPPTVVIQAKIVSIQRSKMEALGFSYSIEDPTQPFDPKGDGALTSTSGIPQVVIQPSGIQTHHPPLLFNRKKDAPFSTFLEQALKGTPYKLTAFIDALQGVSLAEVVANPVIIAMSETAANIDVGNAFHVPTLVQSNGGSVQGGVGGNGGGNAGGGNGVSAGVSGHSTISVGITLDVKPSVTSNCKIYLEISAKRSGGSLGSDGTVTESFQSAKTKMILDNGQTGVIGGLSLNEKSTGKMGVPILKDLPLIGRLFTTQNSVVGQSDVMILVTPTIQQNEDDWLGECKPSAAQPQDVLPPRPPKKDNN